MTVNDWHELQSAAVNGDDNALRYIIYLNSLYQCPDRHQTPGIANLVREWSTLLGMNKSQVNEYKKKVKSLVPAKVPSGPSQAPPMPEPPSSIPELYEGIGNDYPDELEHYRSTSPVSPDLQITSPSDPPQAAGRDWASV